MAESPPTEASSKKQKAMMSKPKLTLTKLSFELERLFVRKAFKSIEILQVFSKRLKPCKQMRHSDIRESRKFKNNILSLGRKSNTKS